MASTSLGLRIRVYFKGGGKCGCAAFSSPLQLKYLTVTERRLVSKVEVNIYKILVLSRKRILRKVNNEKA